MNTNSIKDYTVRVRWDAEGEYFVADIAEIPTCSADGPTPAEAISNLEETFAVLKEAYIEEQMAMPAPAPELPITVGDLVHISGVVNVANLARKAGLSPQTLASKMKRGTEFKEAESRKIASTLAAVGIHVAHGLVWGTGKSITVGGLKQIQGSDLIFMSGFSSGNELKASSITQGSGGKTCGPTFSATGSLSRKKIGGTHPETAFTKKATSR